LKTRHYFLLALIFTALLLQICLPVTLSKTNPKVVMVSIDAARPDISGMLAEIRRMPGLAKIINEGVCSEYMITSFPSSTAVAHAVISTGAPPMVTGITGNSIHKPGMKISERTSGFSAFNLLAEPIWLTADKEGLRAVVAAFPQSTPAYWKDKIMNSVLFNPYDAWLGSASYSKLYTTNRSVRGFPEYIEFKAVNETAFSSEISVGEDKWGIILNGKRVVILADNKIKVVVNEGEWSLPINVTIHVRGKAYTVAPRFKLLNASLSNFRLYRTILRPLEPMWATDENLKREVWNHVVLKTGMITDGDWWGLVNGWYGPETYMETVKMTNDFFKELTAYLLKNTEWDLFLSYTPIVDNVQHQFLGIEKYMKLVYKAYEWADELIKAVLDNVDLTNTVVIVLSDHGQWPVNKFVYINSALAEAGLLSYDRKGRILWDKTMAYYIGYGQVWINLKGREKNGIVAPEEYPKVIAKVMDVLASLRDPDTGEPVVGLVMTREEAEGIGLGGNFAGDVIFSVRPGYSADKSLKLSSGKPVIFGRSKPLKTITGTHGDFPYYRELHAMFCAIGKGLVRGRIPPIRSIDVAPTISIILGISLPANSIGIPLPIIQH